ncbi:MAG: hypothetical protein ACXIU8_05745 [Alkalilacustris sp.]
MPAGVWVGAGRWLAGLGLAVAVALTPPAGAVEIPGQQAEPFRQAVTDWLDDEEGVALPLLAELAAEGNAAARLLLALIDKTPALQGPWLSRLSRDDRLMLMRAPGGMSGRSWMHAAADQTPQADLWLAMWRVDAPLDLPLAFAAAGEARAAREALVALSVRERRGLANLLDDPGYPEALRVLAWREWLDEPGGPARVAAALDDLAPGDPQRGHLGAAPDPEALADWLLSAPEAAGVAALCAARCASSLRDCVLAAHDALSSHRALLVFGSPSEALIPADDFHASPKGQSALLRRMLLAADARGRRAQLARAEARDSCLARQLQDEAQRYIPRRD